MRTAIIGLLFIGLITLSLSLFFKQGLAQKQPFDATSSASLSSDTLVITAVGDIMLGTAYPSREFLPPNNDCVPLLANVSPFFKASDIAFGNLEGVLTDTLKGVKQCKDPSVCYAFAMPTHFAKGIKESGINLLSVANNHVGDFGNLGRYSTLRHLKLNKIRHAGLLIAPIDTFTIKGVRIGFSAFSANSQVNDIRNIETAQAIVRKLKSVSDLVIISFHGGAEGAKHRRTPKKQESYLGENRGDVHKFAHAMIDAGADLLLGHGPHVTRGVEVYKGRFISYSMGNFATYSKVNVSGINGIAPLFKLRLLSNGTFIDGEIISTRQLKYQPVTIDNTRRVQREIEELNSLDFPLSPLRITNNGKMFVN